MIAKLCNAGCDLRWAYYCVSLVVDWQDPERVEKIAEDRAQPAHREALAAWAEHWQGCSECRQEE